MITFQLGIFKPRCGMYHGHLDEALVIAVWSLWIIGALCVKDSKFNCFLNIY